MKIKPTFYSENIAIQCTVKSVAEEFIKICQDNNITHLTGSEFTLDCHTISHDTCFFYTKETVNGKRRGGISSSGYRWCKDNGMEVISFDTFKKLYILNNNIMGKLSSALKRVLSKSMQAQYKAGLRSESLELSDSGQKELLEILALEKEKELTEVANEIIKEQVDR